MPTLYDETGKKIELPYTPEGQEEAAAQRKKNKIDRERTQAQMDRKRPKNAANGPKTTRQQYQEQLDRQKARR